MRVLVVGCGSIGTRRAKILVDMGHEVYGEDMRFPLDLRSGTVQAWCSDTGATDAYHPEISQILDTVFDAALICTPPDSGRVAQAKELASNVSGLFIEKPLALTRPEVDVLESWVAGIVPVTMGACNLRFSEGVDALRFTDAPRNALFGMGQHEKFWSPGHRPISLILDSIHELDLAVWVLGPIESIRGLSDLHRASVSVHHRGPNYSSIQMNRLSDPPFRCAQVSSSADTVSLDIDTGPSMYVREMQHFMDCVEAGVPTCNPIEDAAEVCRWALEVA